MKTFEANASVQKLRELQHKISLTKSRMLLCRLPFNMNKEIPESMDKVFVEYKDGKYDHYALYDDDVYFLNLLCQYYKIDTIWAALDLDGTLLFETKKTNDMCDFWQAFNKK